AASVCSLTNTRSTEYSESRSFSTASLNCTRCCGDTFIVESISRFARNTRDLLNLVERLTEKQVEFVSRKEAIDTTTPTGKFMLTVFAAVAELEREYILQRQREGIAIAKKQVKYTGRNRCLCRITSSGCCSLAGRRNHRCGSHAADRAQA
ncbi:MAG: recombinase family protein, partial [Butyricicoccus sp.]